MFEIKVGEAGVVYLSGRLDASQVDKAESVLGDLDGSVVADFSELDYISSAGIGILMKAYKRLHDSGGTIRLVNMTPRVKNVFHYAGLDRIFTIE
jgi:anti-sigma B factor antagonist